MNSKRDMSVSHTASARPSGARWHDLSKAVRNYSALKQNDYQATKSVTVPELSHSRVSVL